MQSESSLHSSSRFECSSRQGEEAQQQQQTTTATTATTVQRIRNILFIILFAILFLEAGHES